MYDDLVMRLRRYVEIERSEHHGAELEAEAADAIEELRKKVDEWQEEACKWNNEYYHLLDNMPRWISMTERPPEEELCFYSCYTDKGVVVQCLWTNNKYGLGPFGEWGWRLMDVPQYQHVTHWMPLPKPPKEE